MKKTDKEQLLKMLTKEHKEAHEHYKFHKEQGDRYSFGMWFEGQKNIIRKIKRLVKKLK